MRNTQKGAMMRNRPTQCACVRGAQCLVRSGPVPQQQYVENASFLFSKPDLLFGPGETLVFVVAYVPVDNRQHLHSEVTYGVATRTNLVQYDSTRSANWLV